MFTTQIPDSCFCHWGLLGFAGIQEQYLPFFIQMEKNTQVRMISFQIPKILDHTFWICVKKEAKPTFEFLYKLSLNFNPGHKNALLLSLFCCKREALTWKRNKNNVSFLWLTEYSKRP